MPSSPFGAVATSYPSSVNKSSRLSRRYSSSSIMSIFSIMLLLLFDLKVLSCGKMVLLYTGTRGWEAHMKHRSLPWHTVDLNRSPRALDNVGRYRQPEAHPRAVLFGSKKWFKNTTKVFGRNPTT